MKTYSFENLDVWKLSRELVLDVYKIQQSFPSIERFGLGDQLRRAVVSVPSNIAEGSSRHSVKEQIHFIDVSIGSLMEVYCQMLLAVDLKYITTAQVENVSMKIERVEKMLKGLRYKKLSCL